MARSIVADMLTVPSDALLWLWHYHWPSKLQLLNGLAALEHGQLEYDEELEDPDDLGDAAGNTAARKRAASIITLDEFEEVVMEAAHHRKSVGRADAREIYEHLCRFDFLHVPERRASARLDL